MLKVCKIFNTCKGFLFSYYLRKFLRNGAHWLWWEQKDRLAILFEQTTKQVLPQRYPSQEEESDLSSENQAISWEQQIELDSVTHKW